MKGQINYSFKSFSYDDGLVDNYVESIYEDSRGFIWIGTRAGLNRFDGHAFQKIQLPKLTIHPAQNVGGHFISSMVQDSSGLLWIGSLGGLFAYNVYNDTFKAYEFNPDDEHSLSYMLIDNIVVDTQNVVWIGTRNGLNRYNRETDDFTRFMPDSDDSTSVSGNYIESLMVDSENQLWVGTLNNGLNKFNPDDETFTQYTQSKEGKSLFSIRDIFEDSQNNIWLVTGSNGVFLKKKHNSEFVHVFQDETERKPIFFSALSSINEDTFGNIWIGSNMGGVAIFYRDSSNRVEYFSEESSAPHRISGNSVHSLYTDSYKNMWVATHGGGFSLFSPLTSYVSYYCKSPYPNSIPGNIVSSFHEDTDGAIWIGTDGGGLSKFNLQDQSFTNYNIDDGLLSDAVLDIVQVSDDRFFIATWNAGLHIFNKKTETFERKSFLPEDEVGNVQSVYGLHYDSTRNLVWCNTYGHGIQMYDLGNNTFLDSAALSQVYPHWQASMFSSKLLFDSYDNIWFVDGIRMGKANKDSLFFYNSIDSSNVCYDGFFTSDIIETSWNSVFIAKYNGVRTFNPQTGCLEPFFPDNSDLFDVKSLLEDSYGNVWIATGQSLLKYLYADSSIQNMSQHWGMPHLQFNNQAAYRSSSGHLYFGGLNGFVVLHEDSLYSYNLQAPVYFTELSVNNKIQHVRDEESVISKDFSLVDSITLNYDQSFITIQFAVLNYIDNAKSKCKYKLKGFDNQWVHAGEARKATYTNIPPGAYTFCVKTTTSDGRWGDEVYSLEVLILPPWWKTVWFNVLLIVLSLCGIVLFIYVRDKSIREQNRKLAYLVDKKTHEIQEANSVLQEQNNTIQHHYEDLREQQLLISIKNEQLEEALHTKNKLITVIAHDFKNPLSTLLGFVKLLRTKITQANYKELIPNITSVTKSTEAIYSQMVEVLDWSLSKDEAVKYNPEEVNLEEIANTVSSLISESLTQKNIHLYTEYNLQSYAFVDSRMISAVFRNLIINSIKFTPQNGSITLQIIENENNIEVQIHDTGVGMEQEVVDKILSENIVLSGNFQSGFGLQLCKTFIARNKGTLTIKSEPQKGSSFYVQLPKGNKMEENISKKENINAQDLYEYDVPIEDTQRTMLIIDDNREIVAYLKEIFSDSFTVYEAFDGIEGYEKALKTIPEIIISDIRMPGMDGKVLCQKIKTNHLTKHISVILVSAQKLPQEQIQGFVHGADDYITKPFNIDVLKQKVFALLKNRTQLLSHFKEKMETEDSFELPDSFEDKMLKDITNCIYDNLGNPDFKIDMLAHAVGLSRSQLYRKVVSVVGQSPNEYIKTLRLQRSVEMLKTKKYRIAEIAYEVGFSDPGYFSSCFAERYGMKPSEYAKKM
ncbi:MAG: two-component regulator propeller domain-containing protein [Bacteroidales bacterium]